MNLIIDIGNTVAKIAVFKDKDIVEILYDSNQTLECLSDICAKYAVDATAMLFRNPKMYGI